MEKIFPSVKDNMDKLNSDYKDCSDFFFFLCIVGGRNCIVCVLDGMINSLQLSQMIMSPLLNYKFETDEPDDLFKTIKLRVVNSLEMSEAETFDDV